MAKVPFPYIDGLPERARHQLYRDFEFLSDVDTVVSPTEFDAIVDNSLAASDPAAFNFKSIHECINYCGGTAALTRVRILVRFTGVTYSETTTMVAGTLTAVYVRGEETLPGTGGSFAPGSSAFNKVPRWRIAAAGASVRGPGGNSIIHLEGIWLDASIAMSGTNGMLRNWYGVFVNRGLIGGDIGTIFDTSGTETVKSVWATDSVLFNLAGRPSGGSNSWSFYDCALQWRNTTSKTLCDGSLTMMGCSLAWDDTMTIVIPATAVAVVGCSFRGQDIIGSGSGTLTWNFTGGTTADIFITGVGAVGSEFLNVTFSARPAQFFWNVSGLVGAITLAAGDGECIIMGSVGQLDIGGPAHISCRITRAVVGALTLRGGPINGTVSMNGVAAGTFILFNAIGLVNSHVSISATYGGGGAIQAYALDAASNKNIVDFAGQSNFPTASTNLGAGNIIRVT